MKKYIYIHCDPNRPPYKKTIRILAEKINLRKGFDLYVGINPNGTWTVTEQQTGMATGKGCTRKEAIDESKKEINKYSDAQLRQILEANFLLFGRISKSGRIIHVRPREIKCANTTP